MRPLARLLLAAALAAIPIGLALASCGSDADGVAACRQIEAARCDLAPACSPGFDVASCTLFYRDACLVGIANADAGDVTSDIAPCIAALKACGTADGSADLGCPGQLLYDGATCLADGGTEIPATPCNIIMVCPEVLASCHFVAALPDAGADADAADATDDAADADDAADSADADDAADAAGP